MCQRANVGTCANAICLLLTATYKGTGGPPNEPTFDLKQDCHYHGSISSAGQVSGSGRRTDLYPASCPRDERLEITHC
jgi:hypothetical protein